MKRTEDLNKNKTGLALGCFFALVHFVWALLIAITPGSVQSFLNWVFGLHMLIPMLAITGFSLSSAVLLVIVTFIVGYVFGWVFAAVWNKLH